MQKIHFTLFFFFISFHLFGQKRANFEDFQLELDTNKNPTFKLRQKIKIKVSTEINDAFLTARYIGNIGDTIKVINPNNGKSIKVVVSDSLGKGNEIEVAEKAYKALAFPGYGEFVVLIERKGLKRDFVEALNSESIKDNARNYASKPSKAIGTLNISFLVLLGTTVLFFVLFLIFFGKNAKKKKKLSVAQEAEDKYENIRTSRERLVAMVNQDLRKPLDTIINESAFSHNKEDLKEVKTDLKDIYQEGKRLKQVLENLEFIYLYLAGNLKVQKLEHNLKETIKEALQKFAMIIEQKKIIVHDLIQENIFATFDKTLFLRLFEILILEGLQRTPEGASYIIKLQEQGSDALLSFQDTGVGIDSYDFQRLYKPFNNLDAFNFVNKGSLGLNLTFCKIVVETHGSRLEVRTDIEKGTTYFFPININKIYENTINTKSNI